MKTRLSSSLLIAGALLSLSVLNISNADAALIYRNEHVSQGYGLVYDSAQNITWTQFAVAGYNQTFNGALSVVNAANNGVGGYYDLTGWRLPSIDEFITLYNQLPGSNGSNKVGNVAFGPGSNDYFANIQSYYWTNFYSPLTDSGREFFFRTIPGISGGAAGQSKPVDLFLDGSVWLVRGGDVAVPAVPLPAAVWLFGSALFGFLFLKKRQAASKLA